VTRFHGPSPEAPRSADLSAWALVGTVGCVAAGILPAFMTGAVAVQISDELHFGEAGLGLAVAAFFAAASLSSAVMGRLSERVAPGLALRCAGAASAACLLGVAVGARSLVSLISILLIGGVANAAMQPAANLVIAHAANENRQGLYLGLKQGAIPLASLASGLAIPAVALTVGWRWAYAGGGALGIAATALVPRNQSLRPRPSSSGPEASAPSDAPLGALFLLTVGLGTAAAATGSLSAFVVQSGVDAGLAPGTAGYLLAAGSGGAFVVYLLAGVDADLRPSRELKVCSAMLLVGAAALAVLAIGVPSAFIAAVPFAFAIGWGWPGLFNLAVLRSSPSAPGAATGITQTGAYAGVVFGPLAFGFLAEHGSYGAAWSAGAACSAVSAGVLLLCHRQLHRGLGSQHRIAAYEQP
jgi:MFS family permease